MDPVFRWRHFGPEVILLCVRWYCKYGISYRDLEEMMAERGIAVDHTTLYRWVQRYAPELEKRALWYQNRLSFSWRVDETYIKVRGAVRARPDTGDQPLRATTQKRPTPAYTGAGSGRPQDVLATFNRGAVVRRS